MFSNRLAFVALGFACIAAAAGGGYLASRQNTVPSPAAAQTALTPAPVTGAARPVQETEAVVGAAKAEPAPAAPKAAASVTRRAEPPARDARTTARREPTPALTSAGPNSAASPTQPPPAELPQPAPVPAPEPPRPPEPPQKTFEELVISPSSVIGLQIETPVTSEHARVEDRVEGRVTRDIKVGDRVAVAAGARAVGSVTLVETSASTRSSWPTGHGCRSRPKRSTAMAKRPATRRPPKSAAARWPARFSARSSAEAKAPRSARPPVRVAARRWSKRAIAKRPRFGLEKLSRRGFFSR